MRISNVFIRFPVTAFCALTPLAISSGKEGSMRECLGIFISGLVISL
jgi:hypothetical protein